MKVTCERCESLHEVDDRYSGRIGRCSKCHQRLLLPFTDPKELLSWIRTAPWHRVFRFVTRGGAKGHSKDVISRLIRTFEERRFWEEDQSRLQMAKEQSEIIELQQKERADRQKHRLRKQLQECKEIDRLLSLSSTEFELLIANLYRAQGYETFVVGGAADQGIDVEIYDREHSTLWAIAQCKRYAIQRKVAPRHIREFVGSFNLCDATQGFFFTTSGYTQQALETSSGFPWLTLYDRNSLLSLIEEVGERT